MRLTTIYCDICGRSVPQRGWEDATRLLVIETHCTSQNPMAYISNDSQHQHNKFVAEDVCCSCQRDLATTIANRIIYLKRGTS